MVQALIRDDQVLQRIASGVQMRIQCALQSAITLDELVRRLVVYIICLMHPHRSELLPTFGYIAFSGQMCLHALSGLLTLLARVFERLIELEFLFVLYLVEVALVWGPQIGSALPLPRDLGSGLHHLKVSQGAVESCLFIRSHWLL